MAAVATTEAGPRDDWIADAGVAGFAVGMCVMALAAHRVELWALRLAGGAAAAAGVALMLARAEKPFSLLAIRRPALRQAPVMLWWAGFGIALAVLCRWAQLRPVWPAALTMTALSAAAIGLLEELTYRGFLQGVLLRHGTLAAVAVAALAHTAYKCSLMLLPERPAAVNVPVLAGGTFLVGLMLGLARQGRTGLLLPCLFHVVFDIVLYGDLAALPWWTR